MKTPLITVLTPSYNRRNTLPALYESLCNQRKFDFEWMIIDDGSQDGTNLLIQNYIDSHPPFEIRYIWKENGGKASATNWALSKIRTEFIYFMDSDDYLPSNAIEELIPYLLEIRNDEHILGVTGLRIHKDGTPIGDVIPDSPLDVSYLDFRVKCKAHGDYAETAKTKIIRRYPFPLYKGEKFCTEALVWNRMAQTYKSRYINVPLRVAEYLSGGLTDTYSLIMRQSPNGSLLYYKELFYYPIPTIDRLRALYDYWSFYIKIDKSTCFLHKEVLATPIMKLYGVVLPFWWIYRKVKRSVKKISRYK